MSTLSTDTGSDLRRRRVVHLASPDILALATTPIELVPAPGHGLMIFPVQILFNFHVGSQTYDGDRSIIVTTAASFAGSLNEWGAAVQLDLLKSSVDMSCGFLVDYGIPNSELDNSPLVTYLNVAFSQGPILTTSINAAGSGYAPGDTVLVNVDSADAVLTVATVGGGGSVATYTITNHGTLYSAQNGVACATMFGVGTGFVINILTVNKGNGTLDVTTYYTVEAT